MSYIKKQKVYVYGTLIPSDTNPSDVVAALGTMYNVGAFPAVILNTKDTFKVAFILVDDVELARLDSYEGYSIKHPGSSMYIRRRFRDGWIYEWNRSTEGMEKVPEGDWMQYRSMSCV